MINKGRDCQFARTKGMRMSRDVREGKRRRKNWEKKMSLFFLIQGTFPRLPYPSPADKTIPYICIFWNKAYPSIVPHAAHHRRRTSSALNKESSHLLSLSESSELKLPDASLLLNSPAMPGHLGHNTDHSSRVAAAMAENATRKRDINVSASTYPRSKIPKGTLPHMKNVPETGAGHLLPPQLSGRSNIVTEDISKLFRKKTSS